MVDMVKFWGAGKKIVQMPNMGGKTAAHTYWLSKRECPPPKKKKKKKNQVTRQPQFHDLTHIYMSLHSTKKYFELWMRLRMAHQPPLYIYTIYTLFNVIRVGSPARTRDAGQFQSLEMILFYTLQLKKWLLSIPMKIYRLYSSELQTLGMCVCEYA